MALAPPRVGEVWAPADKRDANSTGNRGLLASAAPALSRQTSRGDCQQMPANDNGRGAPERNPDRMARRPRMRFARRARAQRGGTIRSRSFERAPRVASKTESS